MKLPEPVLQALSLHLNRNLGLNFSADHYQKIEESLHRASRDLGCNGLKECSEMILSSSMNQKQVEILASHLTVGETYFFRDKELFDTLECTLLPEILLKKRKENDLTFKVWSAGCSSGEEPYTVAIILKRIIPDIKAWSIKILATDINPDMLEKAQYGIYSAWSFRGMNESVQQFYFSKNKEDTFKIHPDIKKMVSFSYLNLVNDNYPSLLNHTTGIDLLFCRNVLMYFSEKIRNDIVEKLYHGCKPGALLCTAPSEVSIIMHSGFIPVYFKQCIVFVKKNREPRLNTTETKSIAGTIARPEQLSGRTIEKRNVKKYPVHRIRTSKRDLDIRRVFLNPLEECRSYANSGKLARALECLDVLIRRNPLDANYYYLQAHVFIESNEIDNAIESLHKTIYLDKRRILAYFHLGSLLQTQHKYHEAKKYFDASLSLLDTLEENQELDGGEGITKKRLSEIILILNKSGNKEQGTFH